jgi:xylan 1,4-beta-xylosidase
MQAEHKIVLEIDNLPFASDDLTLTHYRIDGSHSNAYAEWLRQNKPMYPAPGQHEAIKARDGLELLEPPRKIALYDDKIRLDFDLPVHGISLLLIAAKG